MDSPTLVSFDFDQFWVEQNHHYSFLFDDGGMLKPIENTSVKVEEEPIESKPLHVLKEGSRFRKDSDNSTAISKKIKTSRKHLQSKRKEDFEHSAISTPLDTTNKSQKQTRKSQKRKKEIRGEEKTLTKKEEREENYKATKNLTKNFGTAITGFASSDLAKPYLETILGSENLSLETYTSYVNHAKKSIKSINTFRDAILSNTNDSKELAACKRSFQAIAIIFMKYFSVNWIIHGRINNKMTYLKWRFRILRRIEEPSIFTYLKFQEKKPRKPRSKKNKQLLDVNTDMITMEKCEEGYL